MIRVGGWVGFIAHPTLRVRRRYTVRVGRKLVDPYCVCGRLVIGKFI